MTLAETLRQRCLCQCHYVMLEETLVPFQTYEMHTVETVVLGHKFFFSTSMFGIGFWRNGK